MGSKPIKDSDLPYVDLGILLENWRRSKFRSALSFFKANSLSFSYSTYMEFERGIALPSPGQIVELAQLLGQDSFSGIKKWVQVQMPTLQLRQAFEAANTSDHKRRTSDAPKPPTPVVEPESKFSPPRFETTWVFGTKDYILLGKHPWLFDLCLGMTRAYPSELTWQDLGMRSAQTFQKFVNEYLRVWKKEDHIQVSKTGIKVTKPYLHLPKTEECHDLRLLFLRRALDHIAAQMTFDDLDKKVAFRGVITRTLSASQAQDWVKKLEILEQQFLAEPEIENKGEGVLHSLVLGLGRRVTELPEEVKD